MMEKDSKPTATKTAAAKKPAPKLHSGKWTLEEEVYVEALMEEFRAGTLDLQEGTTLRSFLALQLNCKPKRISKKYEGKNYDGKQLFWKSTEDFSPAELRMRRAKLAALKAKFEECLEAIEIVKASRQPYPASASSSRALQDKEADFLDQQQRAAMLGAVPNNAGLSMGSLLFQGASRGAAQTHGMPGSHLPRSSAAPDVASMDMLLARHQRQLQAMESFAAASNSTSNQFFRSNAASLAPQQPQVPSRLGSYLSTRQDAALLEAAAAARQDAALFEAAAGFGSLNRPSSPFGGRNPSSPQITSVLGQPSPYNQARLAMAVRGNSFTGSTGTYNPSMTSTGTANHDLSSQQQSTSFSQAAFRPSLNTMLASRLGGRQTSGNRQAQSMYEENMLRFQQPVRDLGTLREQAARRFSGSMEQKQTEDIVDANLKRSMGDVTGLQYLQQQQQQQQEQQQKRQRFF